MTENEQKQPWFLEINPNGRIPALTDTWIDGKSIRIFESGAILQYLVDRYDTDHKVSYPRDSREHWEVTGWVCLTTPETKNKTYEKKKKKETINPAHN